MHINVIVVTKNASIAVRTLHNILNINSFAIQKNNVQIELNYVIDDPFEKMKLIIKKLKQSDRILFIEYGVSMDLNSIQKIFEPMHQNFGCLVFPCVKYGIDWDMFKKKVKSDTPEPIHQMGLNFDTEVDKKLTDEFYRVKSTNPRLWMIDTKSVFRSLKPKKSHDPIKLPVQSSEMFAKFNEKGVRMYAFINAQITITYQHECFSNILESAGVNKD